MQKSENGSSESNLEFHMHRGSEIRSLNSSRGGGRKCRSWRRKFQRRRALVKKNRKRCW
uniref:Uncharacterized protein n=1 Tax=Lotus japonicus TaxID=34305 RepID=I3SCU4_LOTJA|nr:unknown [Lotus japonicus]